MIQSTQAKTQSSTNWMRDRYVAQEMMRQQVELISHIYTPFLVDKMKISFRDRDDVAIDYQQNGASAFALHYSRVRSYESTPLLNDKANLSDSSSNTTSIRQAYNRGLSVLHARYSQEVAHGAKPHLSYAQFVKSIQPWYKEKFAGIVATVMSDATSHRVA